MFSSPVRGTIDFARSEEMEILSEDSFFDSMAKTSVAASPVFSGMEKSEISVTDVFYSFDPQRHEKNIKPLRQQEASIGPLKAKL